MLAQAPAVGRQTLVGVRAARDEAHHAQRALAPKRVVGVKGRTQGRPAETVRVPKLAVGRMAAAQHLAEQNPLARVGRLDHEMHLARIGRPLHQRRLVLAPAEELAEARRLFVVVHLCPTYPAVGQLPPRVGACGQQHRHAKILVADLAPVQVAVCNAQGRPLNTASCIHMVGVNARRQQCHHRHQAALGAADEELFL